ncbi:PaaI family thioesterase [Myxococcota bacterium]|nr:PaaI family thioesterase [Myxococcota bacterium]
MERCGIEIVDVTRWIEGSPFGAALGVEVVSLNDDEAHLRLPFRESNSNPGGALHGGVAASLCSIGAQALTRRNLGADSGPWHTCVIEVGYLAAAIEESVEARARLLRRGKELCFVEVEVSSERGRAVAHATSTVRGRFGAPEPEYAAVDPVPGPDQAEPGPMGGNLHRIPFIGARGIRAEHMQDGGARIVMPFNEANADGAGGNHEGAVLALLDTTGAMAAWAECGLGNYKASTPALQAQMVRVPPAQDLVAYGRCVQRDGEVFFSDVRVATRGDSRLVAQGTVVYRIVT